jgi:hypothetical protein
MARKSPARIRAAYLRPVNPNVRSLPGLSRAGRAALAHLEQTKLWPGAAREALDAWDRFLYDPYHRLFDPSIGCGVMLCCPDLDEVRRILHVTAHALPPRDARHLRRRIAALEDRW